jgi:hypothetical protein
MPRSNAVIAHGLIGANDFFISDCLPHWTSLSRSFEATLNPRSINRLFGSTGGSFGTTLLGTEIEFAPVVVIRQSLDTPDSGGWGQLSELDFAHRSSTMTAPDYPVATRRDDGAAT